MAVVLIDLRRYSVFLRHLQTPLLVIWFIFSLCSLGYWHAVQLMSILFCSAMLYQKDENQGMCYFINTYIFHRTAWICLSIHRITQHADSKRLDPVRYLNRMNSYIISSLESCSIRREGKKLSWITCRCLIWVHVTAAKWRVLPYSVVISLVQHRVCQPWNGLFFQVLLTFCVSVNFCKLFNLISVHSRSVGQWCLHLPAGNSIVLCLAWQLLLGISIGTQRISCSTQTNVQ